MDEICLRSVDRERAEKQALGCMDIYRLDIGRRGSKGAGRGSCEVIIGQCPGAVFQRGSGSAVPDAARRLRWRKKTTYRQGWL